MKRWLGGDPRLVATALSLAGSLPFLLAARPQLPAWALPGLPVVVTLAFLGLAIAARTREASTRALGLEVALSLGLGAVAIYYAALGDLSDFGLATWAAPSVLAGAAALAWWLERDAWRRQDATAAPALVGLRLGHALAFVLQALLIVLAVAAWAWGPAPASVAYAFLAGAASFLPVLALALLLPWPGRVGLALRALALAALFVAGVWYVASTTVALEQARVLPFDEVMYRLSEPGGRAILGEALLTWPAAALAAFVFAAHAPLAARLGRLAPATNALTALRLVVSLAAVGGVFIQKPQLFHRRLADEVLVGSVAPWSRFHARPTALEPMDEAFAAVLRARVEPPDWEEGPSEPLAELAGRYRGRSIVVVVMESQRASDVAGLGEGAAGHRPLSPELSRLLPEGLSFTNYMGPSYPTSAALWTILTGLPLSAGSAPGSRAPQAARLGRLPDFRKLGYTTDFLCPASPRFDNWDRLLGEAGARWWFESAEVADVPRSEWSAWGMPDEQLYRVALRRVESNRAAVKPFLLGLLTVSNHNPYRFPDRLGDVVLTKDHTGGMLYADHHMGAFVRALLATPPEARPIVFVTSDTAHMQGLRGVEPLGHEGLEAFRIPGLLLLPDRRLAGQRFDGLFCHEDLLDLLYLLVAPEPGSPKFVTCHRQAAALHAGIVFLTPQAYLHDQGERYFAIVDRYELEPRTAGPDLERLRMLRRRYREDEGRLWPAAR